jgi:hypothetical protein
MSPQENETYRFLPQTAQLQLCLCCSFIFRNTVSFSTLTNSFLSFSPSPNQNSLIRSRSSVEFVDHIFAGLGLDGVEVEGWAIRDLDAFEEGGEG